MLLAAHQGEEFVLILPLALLGAAFFILKWAAGDESTAEVAVEPPDEAEAADDPDGHNGEIERPRVGVAQHEHQEREGEDAEDEQNHLGTLESTAIAAHGPGYQGQGSGLAQAVHAH